jgi:hypothetical protein
VATVVGFIVDALIALGWWLLPASGRVGEAGDKYTHQLFEAAATLADDSTASLAAAHG